MTLDMTFKVIMLTFFKDWALNKKYNVEKDDIEILR